MSASAKNLVEQEYNQVCARLGQLTVSAKEIATERKALLQRCAALKAQHSTLEAAERAEKQAAKNEPLRDVSPNAD